MALKYYSNYMTNISETPFDAYRTQTDAFVASQWYDSNIIYNVEEETSRGSFEFDTIEVWKNTVSEFTSRLIKDERDFRRLMFKSVQNQIDRGLFYRFDNNYWIVYEGTNEEAVHAEVLVRRCNNVARWIDRDTAKLISMPCVLEYDISSTSPKVDKDIITANSSITLVIQANDDTKKLRKNDRFIFNGQPYKFAAYNNYLQEDYIDREVPLYFIDLDLDIEKPTDDIVNNIANLYEYIYQINIHVPDKQLNGYSGVATADLTLNGEDVVGDIVWSGNDNVTIDKNGNFTLIGDVGDIATITAAHGYFENHADIEIVDTLPQVKSLVISPTFDELNEQESVTFNVDLYIDGIKQADVVNLQTTGVPTNSYSITRQNNTFTLTNLNYNKNKLQLDFDCSGASAQMLVKLKALF